MIGSVAGALMLSGVVAGGAAGVPRAGDLDAGNVHLSGATDTQVDEPGEEGDAVDGDARDGDAGDGEIPGATGSRMEQLREAVPGDEGMSPEGPGSSADFEFYQRAYPNDTISVAQMDAARSSFAAVASRTGEGPTSALTWSEAGPSRALYPFDPLRNWSNYVPNAYVASGRTTSIAISDTCVPLNCRAYITPAGGGVWSTQDILTTEPRWSYLGGPLGINAAGSVTIDPNDKTGNTIYIGTGEANICGSGCVAGTGLYRSTDGGSSWQGPLGKKELSGKGIAKILIKPGDPKTIYAATTTALRGLSSTCCSGVTRPVPGAEQWGLYKSTDGGKTWAFIHDGSANAGKCKGDLTEYNNGSDCSPRGVRNVEFDPSSSSTLYASSYARGVWRSTDAGKTWTQIKPSLDRDLIQTLPAFDVTKLPNGKTRMYVFEGNNGTDYSRLSRSDDVATGKPNFKDLTSKDPADPGFATYDLCGGQCWYDEFVYTPKGYPDMVYAGGSYAYDETIANKRAVVLSMDAGVSATDMTFDGTDIDHPNGLHPDQHDLVTNPNNPMQFFETGDGGVVRSSGDLVDRSYWCDDPRRDLSDVEHARCVQMLSKIPSLIEGINTGLSTLQFWSLSVSPEEANTLQGGTQDNGTWENKGQVTQWVNTMIGDGGQSGFDAKRADFRVHTFYDASPEVNFNNGKLSDWISIYDPIFGQPNNQFYVPLITDPKVSGTMFIGTGSTAYRTQTFGLGDMSMKEAQRICNSWTGTHEKTCGDWAEMGKTPLTSADWGDRSGGAVAAIARASSNKQTAWAATSTGRLFISENGAADPASSVKWTRVDDDAVTPNRFITGISVHPQYPNRAFVSYSGFDSSTPDTPGHIFKVTFHKETGTTTWKDLTADMGDMPVNAVVRSQHPNTVFASTDFGVMRRDKGTHKWVPAAQGLPNVEVTGLTLDAERGLLYAATHGLGAWKLDLN